METEELADIYEATPFPDFKLENHMPQNAKAWIEAIYLRLEDESSSDLETAKLIASSVCLLLKKNPELIENFIGTEVIETEYFFGLVCDFCKVNETCVYIVPFDETVCLSCHKKFKEGRLKKKG